jgi:transcriptional regulator
MYVNPAFRIDHALCLDYAEARGFGLIIGCDNGRPLASPLPFRVLRVDGAPPRLAFHVARVNPLAALARQGGTWMVAVAGPDAYVSPDWYASRDMVPTWLYEHVQLSGPVRLVGAGGEGAHLADLSAKFEAWLAPKTPWSPDKVAPARRDALMKAIVAIELTVETIDGSFKLNQNKADADHLGVVRALAAQVDPAARAIARRMMALRPQLAYD